MGRDECLTAEMSADSLVPDYLPRPGVDKTPMNHGFYVKGESSKGLFHFQQCGLDTIILTAVGLNHARKRSVAKQRIF